MPAAIDKLENIDKEKLKAQVEKPLVALLIGLCLLMTVMMDLPPLFKSLKAQSWPTVQGRIIKYDVTHVHLGKDPAWNPFVLYEYQVGTITFKGSMLRFQPYRAIGGYDAFRMKDKLYTENAPVIVHYNPEDHNESVLQTQVTIWRVVYNLVSCLLWAALVYLSTYPRLGPDSPTPAHLSVAEERATSSV